MVVRNHILEEVETFLSETGMGPSYFGKQAVKNSEIVARLRKGGRIWPETEAQIRAFMISERSRRSKARSAA